MKTYIETSQDLGKSFYTSFMNKGKVTMLNLLRFRKEADYTDLDHIRPAQPISGKDAYDLYMKATMPFLDEAGSKLIFKGTAGQYLIGPEEATWDLVLLVEHESVQKFVSFANNEDYLRIAGHRQAALLDSRLLPITASGF